MSRRDSKSAKAKRGVYVQKPGANVYTGLLGLATLALAVGCALLLWERMNL